MSELDALIEARDSADRAIADKLAALRASCKHTNLVEAEYQKMTFFSTMRPLRLCLDCGAEEEGWGCGYQALRAGSGPLERPTPVTRDELYSLRKPGPRYLVGQSAGESQRLVGWCWARTRSPDSSPPAA